MLAVTEQLPVPLVAFNVVPVTEQGSLAPTAKVIAPVPLEPEELSVSVWLYVSGELATAVIV